MQFVVTTLSSGTYALFNALSTLTRGGSDMYVIPLGHPSLQRVPFVQRAAKELTDALQHKIDVYVVDGRRCVGFAYRRADFERDTGCGLGVIASGIRRLRSCCCDRATSSAADRGVKRHAD